ncbi:MAG TPA: hypothetical protein VGU73_02380, partial [Acidimicrobiia bacterium]|nr:hypothetical protein [Acidimicrobiia bacterium]
MGIAPPRRRWALLAVGLVVLLAGCSTRATLTVTVHPDGSGTVALRVALDATAVQAAQAGGTPLAQEVRLTDLSAAGWRVGRWVQAKDGSASIVVTKAFQNTGQVAAIARELSGPQGPLHDLRASHQSKWLGLAHTSTLDGTVDLRDARSGITADPALLAVLSSQHVDVAALDQQLSAQVRGGLSVKVVADLPGGTHTVTVVAGSSHAVAASSTAPDTRRAGLLLAALALVALALLARR